jgi:hypothetical protein
MGLAMLSASSAAEEGAAIALVSVTKSRDGIEIAGRALALTDVTISGAMTISRKGSSGSVSTKQGRQLKMTAGETADIAKVGVSYKPGDLLDVTLVLKEGDQVIAQSSVTTPAR